jgi:hypothetical protein
MTTATALANRTSLAPVPERCTLCHGGRLALRYPARGRAGVDSQAVRCTSFGHRHHPPIWVCHDCSVLFQWPAPDPDALLRAYQGVEDPVYLAERENRILTFRRALRILPPAEGRTLLDVGAYCGYFLEVARDAGFRAEGLELSSWAAGQARSRGFTVHSETLARRAHSGAQYDLVTLWDVIEHLSDPRAELQAAHRLIRPGGTIVLSTIDTGSLVARLLGSRWPWLMDMHLVYFDRANLIALLEDVGFRVERSGTYTHIVSAGYLVRKLAASFPVLSPLWWLLERICPRNLPIPVNLGDNMWVAARRP